MLASQMSVEIASVDGLCVAMAVRRAVPIAGSPIGRQALKAPDTLVDGVAWVRERWNF
jgi:hypothetical protein